LRDELKFDSVERMVEQMHRDAAAARAEDGGGALLISVRQAGTFATSRPAVLALP